MRTENRELKTEGGTNKLWRGIVLASLLVLGSWFLVVSPVFAQDQPPDLPTYTGWVREAFAAARRNDRLGLEDAAARLIATSSVRLTDRATIAVDNRWLREALGEAQPDIPAIAARLGAILDALAQPPSAAPANARDRLKQLLDMPPFKRSEEDAQPSWLRDFLEWLLRVLEQILRPIGRVTAATGNTVAWVIGIVGLGLLLGIIAYMLRGLRRGMVADAQIDDDPEAHLTAISALDQAGGLARGGDYRTAVRYLYLSALLWLDERNLLRYDRALTNREYLDRVRDNPALRARMTPIVDTFDRVWYGHIPIDADTFEAYREQVEMLRREAISG
jgi:Domain of unknown function (DUF4129)